MCHELPWMLHELVVIYQYQISLPKLFLLDMPVVVGLLSILLYLLMESCNETIFFQFYQLCEPILNNASVIHICECCNSETRN